MDAKDTLLIMAVPARPSLPDAGLLRAYDPRRSPFNSEERLLGGLPIAAAHNLHYSL